MLLEKDFSPTLAGSDLAGLRPTVLNWLRRVPELIRSAAAGQVRIGLKMFNTLDDDSFQLAMLAEVHGPSRPDFLVYANRLFDPRREFDGVTRSRLRRARPERSEPSNADGLRGAQARGEISREPLELSATGDISSGRMALEYALRGCTSFQIHTLFQLPSEAYTMRIGPKVAAGHPPALLRPCRRLHRLGGPRRAAAGNGGPDGSIRFLDLASEAPGHASGSRTSTPIALSSAIRPGVSR